MSVTQMSFSRLTFPIFIQMALLLVIFLTDSFYLSTISDQAVAGVGSAIPVLLMAIAMMHAFSDPGISILGQQLASDNKSRLSATFMVMLRVCTLVAILLAIGMALIARPFGDWIGLDAASSEASYQYLWTLAPIFILDILFINFNSMIFAQGQTRWAMYAAASSAFTNIGLNGLLYLGLIPGWTLGVHEVALTTLIAQLPPIAIMAYAIFKVVGFKFDRANVDKKDFVWAKKRILSISLPATIEPLSYNASQLVIFSMLASAAMSSVAAYTYGKNIFVLFSFAAALAVGIGTQVVIAHYQGIKEFDMADRRMTRSLFKFLSVVLIFALVVNLFADPILSVFTQEQALIDIAKDILLFMVVIETMKAGNYIVFRALKGSGDVKYPVFISVLAHWVWCVGLGYYLGVVQGMGVYGIMIGVAIDEILRFVVNVTRWYKRYWSSTLAVNDPV